MSNQEIEGALEHAFEKFRCPQSPTESCAGSGASLSRVDSFLVGTGYDDAAPVPHCDYVRIRAVCVAAGGFRFIENAGNGVVHLRSGSAETKGPENHRQHVEELQVGAPERERDDILVPAHGIGRLQSPDVLRVVEVSFSVGRDESGVVLLRAGHAPHTRRGDIRPPIGPAQCPARSRFDLDSPIDDRNQNE